MKAMAKNIEKKYREKFYELHATKIIDKDIRDYSVALEKCLMEFHREKMENINIIIRWVFSMDVLRYLIRYADILSGYLLYAVPNVLVSVLGKT